ncbi:MAG: ATP-binding protein [Bacteroidetes bacterium]|nr:ATP-binding protein [Bacteroidota bacterium]
MEATSVRDRNDYLITPNSFEWSYKLLKSVVLYGYNSSGKSNLLTAIALMKFGVLYSYSNPNLFKQSIEPFLLRNDNSKLSSKFEVVFFTHGKKYRYNFEILNGTVISEALFYSEPKIRENNLYIRQKNNFVLSKKWNKETNNIPQSLTENKNFVKENVLFLSAIAGFDFPYTSDVIKWFEKIKIIESFNDRVFQNYTAEKLKDDTYKHNLLSIIRQAKLGFDSVTEKVVDHTTTKVDKLDRSFISFMIENEIISKNQYAVATEHIVQNQSHEKVGKINFDLQRHESTGTRKFFGLIGVLLEAVIESRLLLIDELDAQFHPAIFETIFAFFNKREVNFKGAQLIFTSHNHHLLKSKKIRRDQIYNIQKDGFEGSLVKRFHGGDEKKVRTDASIDKLHDDKFPDLDFNLFTGKLDFPE